MQFNQCILHVSLKTYEDSGRWYYNIRMSRFKLSLIPVFYWPFLGSEHRSKLEGNKESLHKNTIIRFGLD